MKALKYIALLMFVFLFVACSEESPFEVAEEDLNEAEELAEQKFNSSKSTEYSVSEQEKCRKGTSTYSDDYCCTYYGERCYYYSSSSYMSESDKCYYGTSTYGDDYCCTYYGERCNYYSSSSYMSEADKCNYGTSTKSDSYCCTYYGYRCAYVYSSSSYNSSGSGSVYYLTTSKTMKITLKSYKQVSSNWDGFDGAGDPEVSFTIYTYSDGVAGQTINTQVFIDKSDTRSWSGAVSKTYTINKGIDQIKVCPKVIDEDVSSNDNYSSGKCVTASNIGYLTSSDVNAQTDYNSNYNLEWEWYLY